MHLPSRRPTLLALALAVASALPAQQPAQFQAQQTSRKATADLVMGPVIDQMAFPFSDRAYLTNNQPTNIPSAEACREACADNIACLAWNFKHGNPHAAPPVPAGCSLFNVEERDRPSPIHAANFSSGARTSGNLHFPPPANNISMGQPMLNTLLTATDIPSNYLTTGITTAAGCSNACYLISDCTAYTMQSQYKPATASFTYACHLKNAGNGQTVANSPGFTSGMKRNPGTGFANPAIPGSAQTPQPSNGNQQPPDPAAPRPRRITPSMSLFQDQIAFPGNDIAVTPGDSYQSCSDACLRNSACRAWTFNATQPQHPTCHLKSAVSPAVHNAAATSGTKLQ